MILTLFYDSQCPLCMAEMRQLMSLSTQDKIDFVDLHSDRLNNEFPHINPDDAYRILHGQLYTGEIIYGLDVTCQAWHLVGKHKWLTVLRWPLIKPIADMAYRFFARYRNTISYLLTGKKPCTSCTLDHSKKN